MKIIGNPFVLEKISYALKWMKCPSGVKNLRVQWRKLGILRGGVSMVNFPSHFFRLARWKLPVTHVMIKSLPMQLGSRDNVHPVGHRQNPGRSILPSPLIISATVRFDHRISHPGKIISEKVLD